MFCNIMLYFFLSALKNELTLDVFFMPTTIERHVVRYITSFDNVSKVFKTTKKKPIVLYYIMSLPHFDITLSTLQPYLRCCHIRDFIKRVNFYEHRHQVPALNIL